MDTIRRTIAGGQLMRSRPQTERKVVLRRKMAIQPDDILCGARISMVNIVMEWMETGCNFGTLFVIWVLSLPRSISFYGRIIPSHIPRKTRIMAFRLS
jgi:hypothetical protein